MKIFFALQAFGSHSVMSALEKRKGDALERKTENVARKQRHMQSVTIDLLYKHVSTGLCFASVEDDRFHAPIKGLDTSR